MAALTLITNSDRQLKPLIEAAIVNELRLLEAGLRRTQARLSAFEKQYGLTTEEFLTRYENDELQETLDLAEWIGEVRLLSRLREKVEALRNVRFEN